MTSSDAAQPAAFDVNRQLLAAKNAIGSGQSAKAEVLMHEFLALRPDHDEALYLLAVSQRYQDKYHAAIETLEHLRDVRPGIGRINQEMAYNFLALGRDEDALNAFEEAVNIDPALLAAWKKLKDIYQQTDRTAEVTRADSHIEKLCRLPKALLSVASLINEGKLLKAEKLCRQFLQGSPKHIEGMRMLADIGIRLRVFDDAEFLLESAVAFEPGHRLARFDYASVLRRRQKFKQALTQVDHLLGEEPANLGYKSLKANVLSAIGQHESALHIYREMLPHAPARHQLFNSCGHAQKTIGRINEAIEAYQSAYTEKPDFGDAFWSLANLKTYKFTDEELRLARKAAAAPGTSEDDKCHLYFALGKSAEDAGSIDEAFACYEKGNAIKHSHSRYTIERNDLEIRLQREICTRDLFEKYSGSGHDAPDPVFVVGLPRAGSTLLEQILASHSQVDGTLELPNIITMAHKLNGRRLTSELPRYPAVLRDMSVDDFRKLGAYYIKDTRIYRQDAAFFVDKMPNNFRHIGLIQLILPNAKIIDARRHPMACCFSGFKQLFAEGQEFSYGLREIGTYYRRYVELMDHWDEVLPGKVLRVHYEDVVADFENQVQRILAYCGLDFEESCINFHKTTRAVRTPSAEQVRQPIYGTEVDQWRKFEAFLEPLKEALGPVLDRYVNSI